MGLLNLFKSKHFRDTKTTKKEYARIFDFEEHLSLVLDIFMNFKDAYLTVGDRIYLSFGFKSVQTDYSDTYYTRDYYFEMKVYVSDWWDHIMKDHQDVTDGFESVFDKKTDENTFICDSIAVASGTCCFMDWDEANIKLQKFLDKYESEHPGVKFERSNGGAGAKFGDWK